MGIPVTITEEVIARAYTRKVEGAFQCNLNKKTRSWIPVVRDTLSNGKKKGKYCDMQKEHKVL